MIDIIRHFQNLFSESISGRLAPNEDEDDLLSSEQTQSKNLVNEQRSAEFDSQTICNSESAPERWNDEKKPVESSDQSPQVNEISRKSPSISPGNNLVSSTNKEDEEISSQPTQSQDEQKDSDPSFGSDERFESMANEESDVSYSQSEQTESKSEESTQVHQNASEENHTLHTSDDYDHDDSENVRERRNPKTCVEREMPQHFDDNNKPKNFSQNFQRNRHTRPQMLRPHPYGGPGGPDFNPAFMPQYRGARRPMPPGSQPEFMRGHTMPMMRGGPPNHMQRMPPGMQRMPIGPGPHLGPPHQRLQRPPFQGAPQMFGNPGMPPQGKILNYTTSFS